MFGDFEEGWRRFAGRRHGASRFKETVETSGCEGNVAVVSADNY